MINADLKKRIIEISYARRLSHLGSTLCAVDIIDNIYKTKKRDDIFVLSSGHAGLALYVVLEKYEKKKTAEGIFDHHGVHPDRCSDCGIMVSSGSLGHGLPIAVGLSIGNPDKTVHVLISDGECAEGSVWESLRIIKERGITNLKLHININGYGAYGEIDTITLREHLLAFSSVSNDINVYDTDVKQLPFLSGIGAHYYTMSEGDYKLALHMLV